MPTQDQVRALLAKIAATPPAIVAIFASHSDAELTASRDGEWSAAEVLAHLRAADDIQSYRAYAILARDDAPMPAFDERRWVAAVGYAALPPRAHSPGNPLLMVARAHSQTTRVTPELL